MLEVQDFQTIFNIVATMVTLFGMNVMIEDYFENRGLFDFELMWY